MPSIAFRPIACRYAASLLAVVILTSVSASPLGAQEAARPAAPAAAPSQPAAPARPPQYVSPDVLADGRVTFRLYAPNAEAVRLSAGDIVGLTPAAAALTRGDNGIWEVTVGTPEPGSYRYNFNVDGVSTIDPRNPATSESFQNTWSVVHVPGTHPWDVTEVPHGAVARVTYKSSSLGQFRRMHVYTPPGYEKGTARYPVFYLLHGAGDSDDAWTSVGRANFVFDSLIASKKIVPMIVVMPAGHIRGTGPMGLQATQAYVDDLMKDVKPYIEANYRVRTGRAHTAIAGLSMGGHQALNAAIPHLAQFGYIGVYSSGLLGGFPDLMPRPPGATGPAPRRGPTAEEWTKTHAATLSNAALRKDLLLWFATGKEDFLLATTKATVAMFEQQGFAPVYKETDGGHTWIKWRHYLVEFAPLLFRGGAAGGAPTAAR